MPVMGVVRVEAYLGDQWAVIARTFRELGVAARELHEVDIAAHEDRVERTNRAPRGERQRSALDAAKAGWTEQVAEPAVHVVEIAADDDRRLVMEVGERMAVEERAELDLPFEPREPEVHVVDVHRAIDVVVADADHGVQSAAGFLEPPREIDVRALDQRVAREDRVAVVATAADLDVRVPGPVAKTAQRGEHVGLPVAAAARNALVDFLEKQHIRVELAQHLGGALGLVAPVDAADALVDVVADELQLHPETSFEGSSEAMGGFHWATMSVSSSPRGFAPRWVATPA